MAYRSPDDPILTEWSYKTERRIKELEGRLTSQSLGQGLAVNIKPEIIDGGGKGHIGFDDHNFLLPRYFIPTNAAYTPVPLPLSNDGTHTRIDVAAYTITVPFGTRTYHSGSIDPGVNGTFFVYVVDPLYNGGVQAFRATTTNSVLTSVPGIIYLGRIVTTSTGGGGGGGASSGTGGGAGPCFSGNTLIRTGRGNIPFEQVVVGDLVLSRFGWRKVTVTFRHDYSGLMQNMGRLELVTPGHRILSHGEWVPAKDVFPSQLLFTGPVYNCHVEGDPSYTLANGTIAHNVNKPSI